jgi:hypothetical protein
MRVTYLSRLCTSCCHKTPNFLGRQMRDSLWPVIFCEALQEPLEVALDKSSFSIVRRFDSPRLLSASRPRPSNKSPLPRPSAFKSPYIGRAPSTQSGVSPLQANSFKPPNPATPTSMLLGYGQPGDSFQQTTPPPHPFQGLSPFSGQNTTPFQAYTPDVTPQTTGSSFRFDVEEARQEATPLVAHDQASASPLMVQMGDPKQEMHAMYRGVKRPSLREAFEECPGEDCDVSADLPPGYIALCVPRSDSMRGSLALHSAPIGALSVRTFLFLFGSCAFKARPGFSFIGVLFSTPDLGHERAACHNQEFAYKDTR